MGFIFNTTEEYWFTSWVVMRRKFLISQSNNKELLKDIMQLREANEKLSTELYRCNKESLRLRKIEADALCLKSQRKT